MTGKVFNDFNTQSGRPELVEGRRLGFLSLLTDIGFGHDSLAVNFA